MGFQVCGYGRYGEGGALAINAARLDPHQGGCLFVFVKVKVDNAPPPSTHPRDTNAPPPRVLPRDTDAPPERWFKMGNAVISKPGYRGTFCSCYAKKPIYVI